MCRVDESVDGKTSTSPRKGFLPAGLDIASKLMIDSLTYSVICVTKYESGRFECLNRSQYREQQQTCR